MEIFTVVVLLAAGAALLGLAKYQDKWGGKYGADVPLAPGWRVKDSLVSRSFPDFQNYKLDGTELANARSVAARLVWMEDRTGVRANVNSWGRPQKFADFVTALRKRGYHAVDNSRHGPFGAVDVSYPTPDDLQVAYAMAKDGMPPSLTWGEVILDTTRNYLHLGLPRSVLNLNQRSDSAVVEGEGDELRYDLGEEYDTACSDDSGKVEC